MIIGTCSLCGGPVESPDAWLGTLPAPATCKNCGAVRPQHGPVIEMHRPEKGGVVKDSVPTTPGSTGDPLPKWNYTLSYAVPREIHHHHYSRRWADWASRAFWPAYY